MKIHKRPEQVCRLGLVVARVVLNLLEETPIGLIGGVALQYVEYEPLLNGLAHVVEVEWREKTHPAGAFPNSSRVLGFGVAVNPNVENVGRLTPPRHLRQSSIVQLVFLRGLGVGILRFGLFQ